MERLNLAVKKRAPLFRVLAWHLFLFDVTYIPLRRGFLYLVAVMDWASRQVLSWRLSNTLEASFCVEALEDALGRYGAPEVFNT